MESQNQRGQSRRLCQVLELQAGKHKIETNGLAFLEKNQTELVNSGRKMDDEMFITNLLKSRPQSEYEGVIFVIKGNLRKVKVEHPEIEQILEDKYQAMSHAKGWDEGEYEYALFTRQSNKKKPKRAFKGHCG